MVREWVYSGVEAIRVIDGDTLVADIDCGMGIWRRKMHIRLSGVNAPEARAEGGAEATEFVKALISTGTEFKVVSHTWDKYGRLLASFFVDDISLADALVTAGHAVRI